MPRSHQNQLRVPSEVHRTLVFYKNVFLVNLKLNKSHFDVTVNVNVQTLERYSGGIWVLIKKTKNMLSEHKRIPVLCGLLDKHILKSRLD